MRLKSMSAIVCAAVMLTACINNNSKNASVAPPPVVNVLALTVDSGPSGVTGAVNHAYATIRICAPGSQSQCTNIDHVLLDTGSFGLRLVRSVLDAGMVSLKATTDAQGLTIEECVHFGGGQTWGAVTLADVTMAGESAANLPVQVMDDTGVGAPPPAGCGTDGPLLNAITGFGANGVLGVGVFAQDCGAACVNAPTPLPFYYGCTPAGICTATNVARAAQVTNPVVLFASDNNGIIVNLPNLINANGDSAVPGELIFGLSTQTDNALPAAGLTVLGADSNGDFTARYNGGTKLLPALIDSGTGSFSFDDPAMAVCASGSFVGYYCPAVAPQSVFAVNTGVGTNNSISTVNFAIADPNTFVANASAFANLGGGAGSITFTWGVPFFYGRKIYIGIEQQVAGAYTGPFYGY